MSGLRDLINKYTTIAKQLPEQRQKLARVYAAEAHAITADRVQNTGVDARGNKFNPYSDNVFNTSKLNPSLFNASAKVEKFKKDVAKGKVKGSYAAFRKAYGLPTDKRTMTFDGDMFKSIEQVVVFHDEYKTIVEIRASDAINTKKVNQNSRIVGINILAFGKAEKDLLFDLNKERINKLLNQ